MSKVQVTELGFSTLNMLARYMAEFIGENDALSAMDDLLGKLELYLSDNPLDCQVCHELELIGVMDYRQFTFEKYKVLYRYDDIKDIAYVMAFMRQKQSAQELLVSCALL
jgi:plasmid stabilization system protein ParE